MQVATDGTPIKHGLNENLRSIGVQSVAISSRIAARGNCMGGTSRPRPRSSTIDPTVVAPQANSPFQSRRRSMHAVLLASRPAHTARNKTSGRSCRTMQRRGRKLLLRNSISSPGAHVLPPCDPPGSYSSGAAGEAASRDMATVKAGEVDSPSQGARH